MLLSRSEFDPTGPIEEKVVEQIFIRLTEIWHLHVDNQTIRTTGEHPFYAHEKGWTPAQDLTPEDWILTASGDWKKVDEIFFTGELETVYNLRVADHHTYFVGDADWGWRLWAHNSYTIFNACKTIQDRLENSFFLSREIAEGIAREGSLENRPGDTLYAVATFENLGGLRETYFVGGKSPALQVGGKPTKRLREYMPLLSSVTIGYLHQIMIAAGQTPNPNQPIHEQASQQQAIQAGQQALLWFAKNIASNYASWRSEDKGDAIRYWSEGNLIEIEVALNGHNNPHEGPHISVSVRKNDSGKMELVRKVFIEGYVKNSFGVSNTFDSAGYAAGNYTPKR